MPQDGQEHVTGLVDLGGIRHGGIGQGLVDRFIEADDVLRRALGDHRAVFLPELEHTGAQGPVLGDELQQRKAAGITQGPVDRRGAVFLGDVVAVRFGLGLRRRFDLLHVCGDEVQDLLGVVA